MLSIPERLENEVLATRLLLFHFLPFLPRNLDFLALQNYTSNFTAICKFHKNRLCSRDFCRNLQCDVEALSNASFNHAFQNYYKISA